jgi:hypothetical protein
MAQFRKDTHQYLNDGKTIYEVVMLADQYGNLVGPANPSGTSVDAFGRARVSEPYTLMDSFHRFAENNKVNTANTAGGTYSFNSNTSSIDCTVTTTSGASVYRETKRVFAYQPGKSLQIMTTFVMSPIKTNLRQRVGYFSSTNGLFLEQSDDVYFVKRSSFTGAVVDTKAAQSTWNVDKLDGTGPSLLTLDLTQPQILWMDVEWLGVGSVRMGFVINGQMIHCHTFHHANIGPKGAYMQTACLPVRMEIENTGTTASNSTYKQICSTVISEGGYALAGKPRTISTPIVSSSTVQLGTAGTFYPVVSIKLNSTTLDSIVIPKQINVLPINSANYQWRLVNGATITGGVWANVTSDSTVQYNTNATATMSGGDVLDQGFITSTVQAGGNFALNTENLFQYQLERNSFTSTPTTLTLAVACGTATSNAAGSISWEEIT